MSPQLARDLLIQMAASGVDTPAARYIAQELQKVALTPGAKATPIDAAALVVRTGLMSRAAQALRYILTGVTPSTWFSPGQPIQPQAQGPDQGTIGRRFDFPVGTNLNFQPRSEGSAGGVPFWTLRSLADSYDLLRLVIETRKDQIASFSWEVSPKDENAEDGSHSDQIKIATEFFERPTPEHDWLEWLRTLVEDDLVIGSVALYPRLNRGGKLHSLMPVDAATIKRLIDDKGYTPMAPDPAYQQVLKGIPAVDYRTCDGLPVLGDELDSLVYWVRNPRTWKLYGLSPVEQVIVSVNIAMRRQQFQMEYYTEGSIPDMIIGLPQDVTPDQIKEFQTWWDSVTAGNTAVRRKVRFVPEMKGIINPKDASVVLADFMDEWLARIICFAFSIAPTALIKQVNRAQSEQVAETAKEEGLMPFLNWLAWKLTWVTNNLLGCPDVKFAWKLAQEVDPQVKANTNVSYVKSGIITLNEAREDIGHGPVDGGDKAIIITATGPVPLKETLDRATKDALNPPPPPPVAGATPPTEPAPKAPKPAEKIELHVHQAPVTVNEGDTHVTTPPVSVQAGDTHVNLPAMKMGDTHVKVDSPVHVSPPGAPDVFVKAGDTNVEVHQADGTVEKVITGEKGPDGKMYAKVTTTRKAA